jgi:hypothetical protein
MAQEALIGDAFITKSSKATNLNEKAKVLEAAKVGWWWVLGCG